MAGCYGDGCDAMVIVVVGVGGATSLELLLHVTGRDWQAEVTDEQSCDVITIATCHNNNNNNSSNTKLMIRVL